MDIRIKKEELEHIYMLLGEARLKDAGPVFTFIKSIELRCAQEDMKYTESIKVPSPKNG